VRYFATLLLAVTLAPEVLAGPLPDASYSTNLIHHEYNITTPEYHANQTFTGPGNYTLPGTSSVFGIVDAGPPLAHAYATALGPQVSTSNTSISYWFQIDGPQLGTDVPLQIGTQLIENLTLDPYYPAQNVHNSGIPGYVYNVSAQLIVASTPYSVSVGCSKTAYADPTCSPEPTFSGSLDMTAVTGTAYEIIVSAYASVDSRTTSGSMMTAEAITDPMIGFAPGFDATGYSIELSAGIENRLAPEPAVPWLLGIGLTGLAGARRLYSPSLRYGWCL
jgi:hypothetical protein